MQMFNRFFFVIIDLESLENSTALFPIDTPLVLRLVKTHMGKCLFSPELKSYLITQ